MRCCSGSFAIAVVLVFALSSAAPFAARAGQSEGESDWLDVIAEWMDREYVQRVVEDIVEIGSCELGFRVAGTEAEHRTVEYILNEMNAIGLTDVASEAVPVDAWEFKGASLTVTGPVKMSVEASSFGCVQGTDGPITGELVYVGSSYASDYEGLDVTDKIVFTNWDGYNVWIDAIGMMAFLHGAKAIVVSNMDSIYAQGPEALHCQDASWDTGVWPPAIYIPKEYGFQLLELLESREKVKATVESDIDVDLNAVGYNTLGIIPGRNYGTPEDRLLIIGDHHDAWFTGAADDTSAIGLTLGMAKAIIDSGYEPENTLVFTTHTAEEYGTTNVYFDWCVGAWYQITQEHPDWAGMSVAYINLEMQGIKGGEFSIQTPIDLYPFMCEVAERHSDRMPFGVSVNYEISTWNDGWTFTASGVPGITTAAIPETGDYCLENIYHTQLDCLDVLDFDYLGDGCLFMNLAMAIELDQMDVIPYAFDARAAHFAAAWNAGKAIGAGANPDLVSGVDAAAADFASLAGEWASIKDDVPSSELVHVNQLLLEAIKIVESGCTAMEVWEATVYPHEQGLRDSFWIDVCIDRLGMGNTAAAKSVIKNLKWFVGTVWYYDFMPYEYYIHDAIMLHSPDNWGEQTKLGEIVDTWKVIESLEEKIATGDSDFSQEVEWLEVAKAVALGNLESGMETLLCTFSDANLLLAELVSV